MQYAETLSKYHGFMVKKTFDVGLMAAPSSETMTKCLGPEQGQVIIQPHTQHSNHEPSVRVCLAMCECLIHKP